jgi:L-alanine-DL-glutamate epimerase-like enolase superfamily enzyme
MFYRGPDGMAEWAARYVDEGFHAVKYHVMDEGPNEVVETVRQTRRAVGADIRIMVDVHKKWQPRLAVHTARRMEEYDVTWLEEPVAWDDEVGGMQYLSAGTRIAVAAGESEFNLYRCRDLLQRGGIKVLQTDILTAGGYTAWLKMAGLADAYHALISPHGASFPELAAPLIAAVPNGMIVSAFPKGQVPEIWSRLYREPIKIRDGIIELSDRPGLGLEFDEGFLTRYAA